jgi:predicted benzoate:H+ symporter BenE
VIAFVVTLSTFTVAGIPSAFWALFAGVGVSLMVERPELEAMWKAAFAKEPAETSPSG